ncbi:MAG: hypothetical protein U0V18_12785 [Anaerolineales bacterium]
MRNKVLILLAYSIFLFGCDGQQIRLPVVATASPIPPITFTQIPTLTLTKISTTPITSTPTYPSYPVKDVVFEYTYSGGDHGIFDPLVSPYIPKLILYSDGLLIIDKDSLHQKVLSEQEVLSFLSQLEQRGFYTIETNQQHDPTDKLYDFSNGYESAFDGRYLCVSIETKRICAYEPVIDNVVPSMKNIFKFLDSYSPSNIAPYQADRILLQVIEGSDYLPQEYRPNQIEWADDLPPLQKTPILFVDGETATKIFALFDYSESWKIVDYKDKEYTVFARPVLPHEVISQP